MTNQKEVRIEAKTIEAAVVMACVKLGLTQDNIEYEVVKQPKTGLMSIFGGKAEIKAWPKFENGRQGAHSKDRHHKGRGHDNSSKRSFDGQGTSQGANQGQHKGQKSQNFRDSGRDGSRDNGRDRNRDGSRDNSQKKNFSNRNQEQRPQRFMEPREPAEPLTQTQLNELDVEIKQFCIELCQKITGETVNVTTTLSTDRLQVEIDNASIAQMIQDQEKFIESLEHILRKKPRHLRQDLPFRIFVDAQGSRKGRETDIAKVALERAEQVVSTGQKAVLDLRSAADRKIVHMTLEHDERVYTKSIGNGSGRKLLILPSRGRKPSDSNNEQESDSDV
ncbi:MAG: Jag N-terminal domain-containing protein [Proteobacteria bacterium]|nr:Jag N-terminal domain-containing protein [Pseudomonadota bacterium]